MASRTAFIWWPAVASTLVFFSSATQALTPSQVFDAVKDSVVVVKTLDAKGEVIGFGSGVLLTGNRIATNCHVVRGSARFLAGRDKRFVDATLYAGDDDKDICLLDAKDIGGKPANLGKASSLKVGESVYAVGAPRGLELSLSDGIVSQLRGGTPPFIQTTASISHGSSGGGLFDSEARLVGLTTLYISDGQNLNFAMPVEWLVGIKPGIKAANKSRSQLDWITRAATLEDKQDWLGLLAWGKQWVKAEPGSSISMFSIGVAHAGLNQLDQAIAAYRQALRINPEYADAWNNLGNVFSNLNRHDDAISAYRRAISINPEYADAWNNVGVAYKNLNRHDDAITAYRQAIRINPEYADAWNNLGSTYSNVNRHDDAIAAYRQALRISPEFAEAWYNMGNSFYDLKRHDDAISAYRQALRINPEYANAWSNLGITYKNLNRYDEAIAAYRQAVRTKPDLAEGWYNLTVAYYLSGNTTAALQTVKTLRSLNAADAEKLFNMIVPR